MSLFALAENSAVAITLLPNLTSPALSLPNELITMIFIFTVAQHCDRGNQRIPTGVYLSHICRQWRTVALACQELWSTNLPRAKARWTAICLSRAPSILLDVIIENAFMNVQGVYHMNALTVMAQWQRIKILEVNVTCRLNEDRRSIDKQSRLALEGLLDALSGQNSTLENLALSFETRVPPRNWVGIRLPSDICSRQQPPKLREIRLRHCILSCVPPSCLFAANLHSLNLYESKAWPDVDSMIECLQATPLLHTLEYAFGEHSLGHAGFNFEPSRLHQPRCISLRHLENLNLGGFWIHSMTIFRYITAPSHCNIRIDQSHSWSDLYQDVDENTVLLHIAAGLDSFRQHFASAIVEEKAFDFVHPSCFEVVAKTNPECLNETWLLPSAFMLRFPETDNERMRHTAANMTMQLPVFTRTEHATFSSGLYGVWPAYYDDYTSLHEISLHASADLVRFTAVFREKGNTFFPVLSCITLEEGRIDQSDADGLLDLARALRDAHAGSECIKKLNLPGGCFSEETLQELRTQLGPDCIQS